MRQVFDLAFCAGAALLGCGLLVASALHLIASVDLTPEAVAFRTNVAAAGPPQQSTHVEVSLRGVARLPKRTVAAVSQRVIADRPKRKVAAVAKRVAVVAPRRLAAAAPKHVVVMTPRRVVVKTPRRIVAMIPMRVAVLTPRRVAVLTPKRVAAVMKPAPKSRRASRVEQRQTGQTNRRIVSRPAPRRRNVIFVDRLQPSLVGVSGALAVVEPHLDGLRMRGKLVVPTPAPTPPYIAPITRNGLTPGP